MEHRFLYWDDFKIDDKKMAKSKPVKKGSKVVKTPLKKRFSNILIPIPA